MTADQNVGTFDARLRIVLGIACLAVIGYHFLVSRVLPLWALIVVVILVPLLLKTGLSRICPIMKAAGVSTASPTRTD